MLAPTIPVQQRQRFDRNGHGGDDDITRGPSILQKFGVTINVWTGGLPTTES